MSIVRLNIPVKDKARNEESYIITTSSLRWAMITLDIGITKIESKDGDFNKNTNRKEK